MFLREHETAACRYCAESLWYGVKSETFGWKVYQVCDGADGCGRERMVGRISMANVDHRDEVSELAAKMLSS